MIRLLPYELGKIWMKLSFRISMLVLLALNVFLLWYMNIPGEYEPPLSAYRAVSSDISRMTEADKLGYITGLKERIDENIFYNYQKWQKDRTDFNDGLNEQKTGTADVMYTDSPEQENALINELYDEITSVSAYGEYLDSIQQRSSALSGISIFADKASDSFGSLNIEKSAKDHAGLSDDNICWFPSKGFKIAEGNTVTELLMLLSVFLMAGILIMEEKENGMSHITRAARHGIAGNIGAKLLALFVSCMAVSVLLGGSNLIFAGVTVGLGNPGASIQSVPAYMDSSLSISILSYIILGMFTKGIVLFCVGLVFTGVAVVSRRNFMPLFVGTGIIAVNYAAFMLIPAYSVFSPVKYLSLPALLKPELLYGEYMNFNIAGQPVSRLFMAVGLIIFMCAVGIGACVMLFVHAHSEMERSVLPHRRILSNRSVLPNRGRFPQGSLFMHESYKILIMGKAIVIFLAFAVLMGGMDMVRKYLPSVSEQYYRDIMMTLEGGMTEEKEALIQAEKERYDEAFAQIERIDKKIESGELDYYTGYDMKTKWYGIVSLYPSFQRVCRQQGHIRKNGGKFVYDTGYVYLFGKMDDSYLLDYLMLVLCVIFTFGNVMAMEYSKKSWNLLTATVKGKWAVIKYKIIVCLICCAVMAVLPWVFRMIAVSGEYTFHGLTNSVRNIPMFYGVEISIPVWVFIFFYIILQFSVVAAVCGVVFLLSWWRKSYIQAVFFALLFLAVPPALAVMGFDSARWISMMPVYSITNSLIKM